MDIDEDIEKVIENPLNIQNVKHKNNPRVIMAALQKDITAIMYVDDKDINYDIATYVVKNDGKLLLFIPYKLLDKNLCMIAFEQNPAAIQFIPHELITKEMAFHAVQDNFKLLYYIPSKLKDKELCMFAFEKNPESLESIPHKFITKEMLIDSLQKNGEILNYVPLELKKEDICMVAFNQTPRAILYFPYHLSKSDILFRAINYDATLLLDVLKSLLSKELIEKVLLSNPNIIYIPNMLNKIKEFIPEYQDIPLTPELKRQLSNTFTHQGADGVCGRHAFSKVIIKNIIELLFPLVVSNTYQQNNCNMFLKTDDLVLNPSYLNALTPETCSQGGYLKILLFLHLFHLFQTYIPTIPDKPKGWLECIQVSDLYSFIYQPVSVPYLNTPQTRDLTHTLDKIKEVSDENKIAFVTFHFKDITFSNIKKITDHGLYIMLRIEDSSSDDFHHAHFIIIVGTIDNYLLIKNSWGVEMIYKITFNEPFYLNTYRYDKKTDCSFVIPVKSDKIPIVSDEENMTFKDLTHVDEFLSKYEELKHDLQGVVIKTNYIPSTASYDDTYDRSKPCPSHNISPTACVNDSQYRHQAKIFHPDKNPGCVSSSTKKFMKLKTLCKRDDRDESKLLLTAGTRKYKRKRSKRKKINVYPTYGRR